MLGFRMHSANTIYRQKIWLSMLKSGLKVIIIGPIWATLYYGLFRFLIVKLDLKTPGLEYLFENKSNAVTYQDIFMRLLFEPESYYSEQLSKTSPDLLGKSP